MRENPDISAASFLMYFFDDDATSVAAGRGDDRPLEGSTLPERRRSRWSPVMKMTAFDRDSARLAIAGSRKPSTRFEGRQKAIRKNLKILPCCKFDSRLE
jgi:hypothetical protein